MSNLQFKAENNLIDISALDGSSISCLLKVAVSVEGGGREGEAAFRLLLHVMKGSNSAVESLIRAGGGMQYIYSQKCLPSSIALPPLTHPPLSFKNYVHLRDGFFPQYPRLMSTSKVPTILVLQPLAMYCRYCCHTIAPSL